MAPVPVNTKISPEHESTDQILHVNGVAQPGTSSDESEIDENAVNDNTNSGYELLSSDPNNLLPSSQPDTDLESDQEETTEVEYSTPLSNSVRGDFKKALETTDDVHLKDSDFPITHFPRTEGMQLNEDKIDEIKTCMSGFTLPSANHPKWASAIKEEDWKCHLLESIKNNSTNYRAINL